MPTVPRLTSQVAPAPVPGVRVNVEAPIEAFGGGAPAQAAYQAGMGVVEEGKKIAAHELQKANESWAIGARNGLLDLHTVVQDGPNGFLAQKGSNVKGLPNRVTERWQDGIKNLKETANNDSQRAVLDKMAVEQWHEVNHRLQTHVYEQGVLYEKQTVDANQILERNQIPNFVGLDGSYNQKKINDSIARQHASLDVFYKNNGASPEALMAAKMESASKSHIAVIDKLVANGLSANAQKYFNANKIAINEDDKNKALGSMEKGLALDRGTKAYVMAKENPEYQLANGTLDDAKVEDLLRASDLPTKQVEDAITVYKSKSGEHYQNTRRAKSAKELEVMNNLLEIKHSGQGAEVAMKYANEVGVDQYEKDTNMTIASKIFAQREVDNPVAYMDLMDRVKDGLATRQEIDEAFMPPPNSGKQQLVSEAEYKNLRTAYHAYETRGTDPNEKGVRAELRERSKKDILDPEQRASVMRMVDTRAQGKSSEERVVIYNDLMKDVSRWRNWEFFEKAQWKDDLKRQQAHDQFWGELKMSVGGDTVNAIGEGVKHTTGKPMYDPEDINSFAANFEGGMSSLRPGNRVHDAIQALQRTPDPKAPQHHILVTPANVKFWLSQHPEVKK